MCVTFCVEREREKERKKAHWAFAEVEDDFIFF